MADAEGEGVRVFSECAIAFVPSSSLAPRLIGEVSLASILLTEEGSNLQSVLDCA